MQSTLRAFSRLVLSTLLRMTVTGRENIPAKGPLLIVANHLSTIDPSALMAIMPRGTRFVGPGDFKLLFPANLFLKWGRPILVKRSAQIERSKLKEMIDFLSAGGMLVIFPEGGTWEKPITDAKSGAAYLSLTAGAPILPVGLGNTYRVWYKATRLQRPHVTINIGPVMPPVQMTNRAKRSEALDTATQDIMQRIYQLLPAADRAWYDDQARRLYDLSVEVWRRGVSASFGLPGRAVLGELMLKPNLLSPLVHNAGLPLDPLRWPGLRFTAASIRLAATSLQEALQGPFVDYIDYRLGEAKSRDLQAALSALIVLADDPGVEGVTLKPSSRVE
jgi:1-acyl-sn-glycerol-3-phosphate acyltransferase